MSNIPEKALKRFWALVDKQDSESCWNWKGKPTQYGYGEMKINNLATLSHRISWVVHNGSIPHGICVLHECDNRLCVNPNHLFLGTKTDNNADKVSKNRQAKGEKNGRAKLTSDQVREIREKHAKGASYMGLGRKYNVSNTAIKYAVIGKNWRQNG